MPGTTFPPKCLELFNVWMWVAGQQAFIDAADTVEQFSAAARRPTLLYIHHVLRTTRFHILRKMIVAEFWDVKRGGLFIFLIFTIFLRGSSICIFVVLMTRMQECPKAANYEKWKTWSRIKTFFTTKIWKIKISFFKKSDFWRSKSNLC